MTLGLEPYQVVILTYLVLALLRAVALVSVFLLGALVVVRPKQLTFPARAVNPLSPSPRHAHPVLPPLVR